MKKKLLLMAMTSVALASCVNEEVVETQNVQEKAKIIFDMPVMYDKADSRANVYGELGPAVVGEHYMYPNTEQFVVYVINHTNQFTSWSDGTEWGFNGQPISYEGTTHAWAPKKDDGSYYYWPAGYLSFAATSPAVLEQAQDWDGRSYGDSGLKLENYVVGKDLDKQIDVLFSERILNQSNASNIGQTTTNPNTAYNGIPIQFKHALSSVHFAIQNELAMTTDITLTSITIEGVYGTGSFNQNLDQTTGPSWIAESSSSRNYEAFTGKLLFPYSERHVAKYAAEDTDASDENEKAYSLLLLPQTFSANSKIVIKYTIEGDTNVFTKEVYFNDSGKEINLNQSAWEIGKRYLYLIKYSKETQADDMILFAPSVEGWQEEATIVIEL